MPLRAFLLFGPSSQRRCSSAPFCVSMPLRAFLLFGQAYWVNGFRTACEFQCPCGHFCFSDLERAKREAARGLSFNALAGIFAFRTFVPWPLSDGAMLRFNALAGIFAFRTRTDGSRTKPHGCVSMPLRAFLLFGRSAGTSSVTS